MKEARELIERPLGEKLQRYAELQEAAHYGWQVTHVVDKQQVREKLQSLLKQDDLSKYIL
jgi:ATP-dependent protease HslVU (ClpYQ) ATPase subunit